MATMILSTVGGALGGPLGGVLGGFLGSLIDQQIFGLLQDPIKGPRLEEFKVPSFDEGSPAPFVLGRMRVPGQVIWLGGQVDATGRSIYPFKPREVQSTSGGKGGGGGGSKTITYEYYTHVAIAFARQSIGGSQPIKKIRANGEVIYEVETGFDKTSTSIVVTKQTENKTFGTKCQNKPWNENIEFRHPTADYFKGIKTSQPVTISGAGNAANNGTFTVLSVANVGGFSFLTVRRCTRTWNPTSGSYYIGCTESGGCTGGVTEAAGNAIRVEQTGQALFNTAQMNAVTQYNGSASQVADPLIVALEGTGNVPAHRGTVYAVINNLKVTRWGGTIPAFEAEIEESNARTVGAAIGMLMERNERVEATDYDVTGVSGTLPGMAVIGPKSPVESIQSLMAAYDVEAQAKGTVVGGAYLHKTFFFHKDLAAQRTVDNADRGAKISGDESHDILSVSRIDPQRLPTDVYVSFLDREANYEPAAVNFRRQNANISNEARVSLPIALTKAEAYEIARKMMWALLINERLRLDLTLPPTYVDLAESDIIAVNDSDGKPITARVTRVDHGNNHLIEIEALEEVLATYT